MNSRRPETSPSVTGPMFVPTMHGIRGYAVLVVVLFHIGGAALWTPVHGLPRALYEAAGPLTLDAMFVISGFVLFLPVVLNGGLGSVGGFAIRRFARMGPPYYVCMALVLVSWPLLTSPALDKAIDIGPSSVLIHIGFLQRELSPHLAGFGVNSPVWSLSIDLVFYLVLPFIATRYLRHPFVGLALALAATATWRTIFIEPHAVAGDLRATDFLIQPPLFMADFASGMTAAWVFVRLRQLGWQHTRRRMVVAAACGSFVALLALAYLSGSNLPFHLGVFQDPLAVRVLLPLALGIFAVAMALAPARLQWPLTNRAILWFAEISYSVFLYHFPIIFLGFFTLGISRDGDFPWLWTAVVLPASIAVATLSYFLIEQPSRRYGRRLAKRFFPGDKRAPKTVRAARAAAIRIKDPGRI